MAALGIIGIVVGVAVLIYGAYKGISTIILAPLCALLIALFNGMNLLTTFTDTMLPSVCNYVTAMLGPVLMGCVIAALYNASGAALSIANALYDLFTIKARKQAAAGQQVVMKPILAILTIYVIGTVLAYSGMNPVVLMFILFPIAMDLFEKAKAKSYGPWCCFRSTCNCSMLYAGYYIRPERYCCTDAWYISDGSSSSWIYRWCSCPDPEHRYDEHYL